MLAFSASEPYSFCVAVSKSKRTPVRLRHKIEKASAAKQRKIKKDSKKASHNNAIQG